MTWHADQVEGRPQGDARHKLLAQRAKLVKELEDFVRRPPSRTEAGLRFDREDQLAVAKKIVAIDKKLGRI